MRKAVQRLTDRLPDLADRLVAEILRGDGEEWERPSGLRDDLWQVCHIGLGHGMEAILDPDRGRTDLEWAARLGRRRAEQGQPLDQLLRSYRLAGMVFWEAVVEAVAQDEPAHVPTLVRHATRTWYAIDEQSSTAAAAYHRTEYDLLRRNEERMQAVVDALLEGHGTDGGLLATANEVLGLPEQGRYAVVVLGQADMAARPGPAASRAGVQAAESVSTTGGIRFLWRMRAETQVALVALGNASLDELIEAVRPHVRAHAGVSPVVHALSELGTARWLAELALRTCWSDEPEIALLDRRLPAALVVSQPRLAGRLGRTVLGPLYEIDPVYRDVLLSTLTTWLECDGSAARAAARLYCHHNTVLNRLRRIEQLTGRLLARPGDLTEVVLALSAVRLLDPAPGLDS
ncbi:PucR family transcriptional regulator [Actinomadura rugatobispora]|uniref:PucR family transcriptional regulator n=1 Tax=Actinomadura rugatobispora TaxID=1994 RepID=A0ABW1A7A7_9ACTN|nr:helix-turn-helix domain-containing protein [Actinomadura rugatobispora]